MPVRGTENWPVKTAIDLSNAFGEFRSNRFHAGVDIRTGGKIGTRVYAPVKGHIWRIKMTYDGYGKGLYLKGDDGHLYVFGHLEDFASKIDRTVKFAQVSSRRYYQDLYFPKDSIPVDKGEFIALSGRTGGTAPHLHFEKRTPDNYPVNPLLHGFGLKDSMRPVFSSIVFRMIDDSSLFDNADRTVEYNVTRAKSEAFYSPDTVLYFSRPFGVLAKCYDQTRPGGMHLTPYRMTLYIDDTLRYEVLFDTLDFEVQRSVNFEYDLLRATGGEKRVRRLFHLPGNEFRGSRAADDRNGIFGLASRPPGLHRGRIVASDHAGNTSELHFKFMWGISDNLYGVDRTDAISDSGMLVYLSPRADVTRFGVDSVAVLENIGGRWEKSPRSSLARLPHGQFLYQTLDSGLDEGAVTRLFVFANGCTIGDLILSSPAGNVKTAASLRHEIVTGGLLVTVDADSDVHLEPQLELYYGDSLLGTEAVRFVGNRRYATYIQPGLEYPRIDSVFCRLAPDGNDAAAGEPVSIFLVGAGVNDTIATSNGYSISISKDNLYVPRFIELRTDDIMPEQLEVYPEAFACRTNFEISAVRTAGAGADSLQGLCWWDKDDREWVWLDSQYGPDRIASKVTGGGVYSLETDRERPSIRGLSITDGLTYFNPQHPITFYLSDNLSGFADDRSIVVELDGQWMIPEYNPDTKVCKTYPLEPLPDGRHDLKITAVDRAGNRTEQRIHFFVKKQ